MGLGFSESQGAPALDFDLQVLYPPFPAGQAHFGPVLPFVVRLISSLFALIFGEFARVSLICGPTRNFQQSQGILK